MRTRAIAAVPDRSRRGTSQDGYAMAALLVAIAVMTVLMTAAMPVWNTQAQREKEAELVFRGEQYARAVMLYQRKFANALPPSLDVLLNDKYLRKKYKDPITGGDFQLLSGASVQANAGVPGGQVPGSRVPGGATPGSTVPGGRATTGGTTGTTGAFGQSGAQTTTGGTGSRGTTGSSPAGFGLGAGVGFGAGGSVPGGIMGVTSTSAAKSLRLYNGRGAYNEWTFVPVQRNLTAGAGAQGANTPGGTGRGGQGRGSQTPGRGGDPFRPSGGTGGSGSSPFRPPSGTFGTPQGR
jgi:type II secretory pathway pseudopilin PulG